jgi:cell wall-associated NlpC family hydrolase
MTSPHRTCVPPAIRRLAIALVAAASAVPLMATPLFDQGTVSAARPYSTSPELAGLAVRALGALDQWDTAADPDQYVEFVRARDEAATLAAAELGLDPGALRRSWAAADPDNQRALLAAITQLGVPYRTNRSEEGVGFDCSGLTTFAWARAGVALTRQSGAQIREAEAITREEAQAGDLVHYPGHVSMYLGVDNAIVHSPYSGRDVEITFLSERRGNSVRFGDPTPDGA